jgi:hypothetical protein
MWLVAETGEARPLSDPVTFTDAMGLAWYVAQLGPKSYSHVVEAFAVEVGLPDGEAA